MLGNNLRESLKSIEEPKKEKKSNLKSDKINENIFALFWRFGNKYHHMP